MDEKVGMEEINPFKSPALLAAQAEVMVRTSERANGENLALLYIILSFPYPDR